MRLFILKTAIITLATYILFQFTIGHKIEALSKKVKSLSSQHERIEIKQKILNEMKKGLKKENIFSDDERIILSDFLNKILLELKINPNKNN